MTENTKLINELKNLIIENKDNLPIPIDCGTLKLDQDPNNKYCINVTWTLPEFTLAIDEDGELWHICTCEGIDLKYQIKDGKVIVYSDDEDLLELLEEKMKK